MSGKVRIEYNADDFPVAYECSQVVQDNLVTPIQANFLYDLVYKSSLGQDRARQFVETSLLQQVASEYGLEDGSACEGAPTSGIWLVRASSNPQDVPNPDLDECYELTPGEGESCVSLQGIMTGYVIGPDDISGFIDFIATQLNSGDVNDGSKFRAKFLGTSITQKPPRENTPEPIVEEPTPPPKSSDDSKLSTTGIALISGLVVVFAALAFVLYRRRKHVLARRCLESQHAVDRAHMEHNHTQKNSFVGGLAGLDGMETPASSRSLADEEDSACAPEQYPPVYDTYAFEGRDVGGMYKKELMGIHGHIGAPPSAASTPARSVADVSSESDVDSWAQADGTLNSLDLYPNEGEV